MYATGQGFDWSINSVDWSSQACAIAGRSLTQAEWDQYLPNRSLRSNLHAVRVLAGSRPSADRPEQVGVERDRPESPDALGTLTPRESEVFGLVARGLCNAEIADALVVTEATVETHFAGIFGKLGLRNRAQAVVFAYESRMVRPGAGAR